jgi:hypothetical protein
MAFIGVRVCVMFMSHSFSFHSYKQPLVFRLSRAVIGFTLSISRYTLSQGKKRKKDKYTRFFIDRPLGMLAP